MVRAAEAALAEAALEARAKAALLMLVPIVALRIDVDVERGVLYLRGIVVHPVQRRRAEEVVRSLHLPGVHRIANRLVVRPDVPFLPGP
ncbi:MAG TPA: BON domain-containing protein [Chloroflexota bacterium]